ncbi:glycosyltransferase family protein [Actinomyces mediterranea]|uniref:glycosyltransferase family protein n=1 Tax=Actinomyces mediterranea TaxID=1871028 RepID=UPI0009711395|nr:glycosyltransferase [Actinomyces mediterranea]
MAAPPFRVALYSHDSLGLGHLRRNLTLAHRLSTAIPRLTGRNITGMLICGIEPSCGFPIPEDFDWLVLPGISKGDDGYRARRLNITLEETIRIRSVVIGAAFASFAPDLVIIDRHIYGINRELRVPLDRLRRERPRARVVLGLRDVLDAPAACRREWAGLGPIGALIRLVDDAWIYGDPSVHDARTSGEIPAELARNAHCIGYLAHGRRIDDDVAAPDGPYILTCVGGGRDGHDIVRAAAQMPIPTGYRHIIVTGPQAADGGSLGFAVREPERTRIVSAVPGLGTWIANASAVIAMGGYNTIAEILATSVPALVIPRRRPRTEQLIRALALDRVGAVDVLREENPSPHVLYAWANTAITRRVDRSRLALNGLDEAGARAASLLADADALPRRSLT